MEGEQTIFMAKRLKRRGKKSREGSRELRLGLEPDRVRDFKACSGVAFTIPGKTVKEKI